MVGVLSLFSVGATICSGLLFASPMDEIWKMQEAGSSKGKSYLPVVCMWMNCCLWGFYGGQQGIAVMLLVNFIGCVLNTYYITVWLSVVQGAEKVQVLCALLVAAGLTGWVALYAYDISTGSTAGLLGIQELENTNYLPLFGCIMTVIMFASPLVLLRKVVRERNASYLNFKLMIMSVANCVCWVGLGIIYTDPYMLVPNGVGLLLSLVQVALYLKYPSKPTSSIPMPI